MSLFTCAKNQIRAILRREPRGRHVVSPVVGVLQVLLQPGNNCRTRLVVRSAHEFVTEGLQHQTAVGAGADDGQQEGPADEVVVADVDRRKGDVLQRIFVLHFKYFKRYVDSNQKA